MSFKAAAWAIEQEPSNSTEKLVLICLCNNADDEIFQCWPSHDYLARKAMCSPRTVRRAIHGLVTQGYISVVKDRRHKGQSNVYQVHVNDVQLPPETPNDATGQNDLPPPVTGDLPTGHERPEGRTSESPEAAPELDLGVESINNQSDEPIARFKKPSQDEVLRYMQEIWPEASDGYWTPEKESAQFWDYWESQGWKRRGGPMKDWKASVRTWLRNNEERRSGKGGRHNQNSESTFERATSDF